MQIRVLKSGGQIEPYLHTKVLGTLAMALAQTHSQPLFAAQLMAEAITFYLYRHIDKKSLVSSDEIYLMIQAMLEATGCPVAAAALRQHRLTRQVKRSRIEVVGSPDEPEPVSRWDKNRLTDWIARHYDMQPLNARAIASAVEAKVLAMDEYRIRKSLLRQLIACQVEAFMDAQRHLDEVMV